MIEKLRSHPFIRRYVLSGVFLFLLGCASKTVPPEPPAGLPIFKRVAIVPFQNMSKIYGENVTVQCHISNRFNTTGKIAAGAEVVLTDRMSSFLRGRESIELVPASQAEGAYSGVLSQGGKELSELELLIRVGRELGVDGVVIGKVYRYIDRDGSNYSVKSSASVAYDVFLIRVEDGRLSWSGQFDESQKSLTENLFDIKTFFRRKGRWVTAEQMATQGLEDLVKTFPAQ